MSTNLQKRITKQVRVLTQLHKLLKVDAAEKGITIAKLLDEIVGNHYQDKQLINNNNGKTT